MLRSPTITLSPLSDRRRNPRNHEIRRRPDATQGRALEILGHALEYLVDVSRGGDRANDVGAREAVLVLAAKSREVFAECAEVVTFSQRLTRLLPEFLTLPAVADPSTLRPIGRDPRGTLRIIAASSDRVSTAP